MKMSDEKELEKHLKEISEDLDQLILLGEDSLNINSNFLNI